jgi:lipoprotein-releasing system permease protein
MTNHTLLKGVDSQFDEVNDIKKTLYNNGQWLEKDTSSSCRLRNCAKIFDGILDFNNQLEVWVQNLEKELESAERI